MLTISKKTGGSSGSSSPLADDFDEDSLSLDVFAAERTATGSKAGQRLGTVEALVGARADGAQWRKPDGALVAKSNPWSVAGWLSDAPDMRVGDCAGEFLAVVNMDPVQGPGGQRFPQLKVSIRSASGDEAFYVEASDTHILGQKSDDSVYHVFGKERRLVGILRRQGEGDETGLEWLVQIEKGCGLDLRVAVIVVAQLQAEGMRGAGSVSLRSCLTTPISVPPLLPLHTIFRCTSPLSPHHTFFAGSRWVTLTPTTFT
ncbi:hypothetical protein T484DRAFT_3382896 [Baffinella frigidus]|nr:hypothetical protein T484DRAFT_3382896 [Cryptophyta sp. CCMP2293]